MITRLSAAFLAAFGIVPVHAVIFDATGDPTFNTTAPDGALSGSGWQYQGEWGSFLGTPIAPNYFITAAHVGGGIGQTFRFQGLDYTTDASFTDSQTDLILWRVTEAFPSYAPLYTGGDEVGLGLVVFGRGTQRSTEVRIDPGNVLTGWNWGASDGVQRWGTNVVSGLGNGGTLLAAEFNHIGGTESHLSTGDSGGAVFIQDPADNVWKLAGINFAVSGPYYSSVLGGDEFNASLFDQAGQFIESGTTPGVFVPAAGAGEFFATRISTRVDFIAGVIPEPGSAFLFFAGAGSLASFRRRSRGG